MQTKLSLKDIDARLRIVEQKLLKLTTPPSIVDATPDQHLLEIKHALNTLLDRENTDQLKKDFELIDRKELARRLNLHEMTVSGYIGKGIIKPIRIGGALRFDYAQVLSDLRKSKTARHGK